MTRKVYLEDIPLDEAWRRFSDALKAIGRWRPIEGEDVPVAEALGRVTAKPIWAQVSSPAYHASAMDGFAVRAEETITANDTHPLQLELGSQAQVVDTGDPLPGWADAVIMIEHVQPIGSTHIEIRAPCAVDGGASAGRGYGGDGTRPACESHAAPGRSRRVGGQRTCHRERAP
jgi:putative molybdopterin biosynthesis protein